ncbi:MAG TPA: RidA family protein [Propionibacteriaceae bacterium]|nr:RidA family protein [Propionibacteriaceae bacterium]HQE31303.1 RidA family protein [Propionibacteriaceae bacterium]
MRTVHPEGISAPVVPISPGMVAGGFLYVSGQVATEPDNRTVFVGDFEREVELTLDNVEAILAAGGASWDKVVKVNAFLSSAQLFPRFNEVYAARLGDARPARTTVVVGFGHPDARVEVDCVAFVGEES